MSEIKMSNWKIVPIHGGGVALLGEVDGKQKQTTNIVKGQPGKVMTESGTVYTVAHSDAVVGMWGMQLQIKRPTEFANLQKFGVL